MGRIVPFVQMRKVVSNIFIDNDNKRISCLDKGGNSVELLKHQGDLDGACATYCVVMNLLTLRAIYDSDTRLDSKPVDKRTHKFIKKFFLESGMHHFGQSYIKIKRMFDKCFDDKLQCVRHDYDEEKTLKLIESTIDEDLPIIISVQFTEGAHALLAVGYEKEDETITKILCLDSDSPKVCNKRWNAEIELYQKNRGYKHLYKYKDGARNVSLTDVLIISRR